MSHEEIAFLSAIHANLNDPFPWMAYSDWLEERGDPAAELYRVREITNSIGMKFRTVPTGTFLMGSPEGEGYADERPQHEVTVAAFRAGVYQVTQEQWRAIMGTNPSYFQGDNHPVERVSWHDCQEFIKKLSEKEGVEYSLFTEEEWEYACRAGTTTRFYTGDDEESVLEAAWCSRNSNNTTHPVGLKLPNAFGLYDMHGNVWEWCQDVYDAEAYQKKTRGRK